MTETDLPRFVDQNGSEGSVRLTTPTNRIDFEERKRRHVAVLRQTLDPPAELNEARFRVCCWVQGCEYVATSGKRIQDAWDDAVAHDREVHQGGAA